MRPEAYSVFYRLFDNFNFRAKNDKNRYLKPLNQKNDFLYCVQYNFFIVQRAAFLNIPSHSTERDPSFM